MGFWLCSLEKLVMLPRPEFWQGKKVLLTGHTGFKGSWLALWLHELGAQITGIALAPESKPNLFSEANIEQLIDHRVCDIRELAALNEFIGSSKPEIVIHLAAQALVRKSYSEPVETFATNIMGSANVLEAIRHCPGIKVAVMVTTDKVYEINGSGKPFMETDRLGGHDPYSASKAASELVISSYHDSFLADIGVAVASARAGNVIGGGDWSEDRLIPDAIKSWQKGQPLEIRMPGAVRPWQHVLDALCGYLILAEQLWSDAGKSAAYNFGPDDDNNATVKDVIERARTGYYRGNVHYRNATGNMHETELLTLDTSKAKQVLNFTNRYALDDAVQATFHWYRQHDEGRLARDLCQQDIEEYQQTP